MKKVLLLTDKPFAQVAIDGIQKVVTDAGYELKLCEKYGTDMDRVKRVAADVDAMIIRSDKVTPEIMDAAPNLKIIVRAGAGYDNVDLEADFLKFATERGMVGIKGHRSVGGFRASCYNAMPKESVQALIDCMQEFEKLH